MIPIQRDAQGRLTRTLAATVRCSLRCPFLAFSSKPIVSFKIFRARFVGKCSPVHFFRGAADLAVTRLFGRKAPQHPGGVPNLPDWITQEAYSHEVSSCGFRSGSGPIPYAAFYSYAYPEPPAFSEVPVKPDGAFYSDDLREFILPYDRLRESESPDQILLEFLPTTYEAAANLAHWDRAALECSEQPKYGRRAQSGAALIR